MAPTSRRTTVLIQTSSTVLNSSSSDEDAKIGYDPTAIKNAGEKIKHNIRVRICNLKIKSEVRLGFLPNKR